MEYDLTLDSKYEHLNTNSNSDNQTEPAFTLFRIKLEMIISFQQSSGQAIKQSL